VTSHVTEPKDYYSARSSPPLVLVVRHANPVKDPTLHLFDIHFSTELPLTLKSSRHVNPVKDPSASFSISNLVLSFHQRLRFPSGLFPSVSPTKTHLKIAKCPAQHIFHFWPPTDSFPPPGMWYERLQFQFWSPGCKNWTVHLWCRKFNITRQVRSCAVKNLCSRSRHWQEILYVWKYYAYFQHLLSAGVDFPRN